MRPEFSRPLPIARLGHGGLEMTVEADEAECQALAPRLQVAAIARLSCRFVLAPARQGRIVAEGDLDALLTQVCVVSLEPFESVVRERFVLHFVPEGSESDDPDPDLPDETGYADGSIDLGEAAAEQLALTLDPYPRRPGIELPAEATLGGVVTGEAETGEAGAEPDKDSESAPHPFAALARLRRNGQT